MHDIPGCGKISRDNSIPTPGHKDNLPAIPCHAISCECMYIHSCSDDIEKVISSRPTFVYLLFDFVANRQISRGTVVWGSSVAAVKFLAKVVLDVELRVR
jgi:hypothetical protein